METVLPKSKTVLDDIVNNNKLKIILLCTIIYTGTKVWKQLNIQYENCIEF